MPQSLARIIRRSNQRDEARIDTAEAERFLSLLDPDATEFCFQTFADDKREDKSLTRILFGTFAEHRDELVRLNRRGAGVFVSMGETRGRLRKAEDIIRVRAVSADLDGQPIEPVNEFDVKPHLVIETSPGRYHAYWFVDDLPLDKFVGVQFAIAAQFDSDTSVGKLTHIARLPGFFHCKAERFLVRIVEERDGPRFAATEIVDDEAFAPLAAPHKLSSSMALLNGGPMDSALEFVRRFHLPDPDQPGVTSLRRFRGRYYRWVKTHYQPIDDDTITRELYHFLHYQAMTTKNGVLVKYEPNRSKVSNIRDALQSSVHLDSHTAPPFTITEDGEREELGKIACRNGILDIETRELTPHRPEFFCVNSLPFDYDPDAPKPVRWFQFLHDLWGDDPECRATLREIMGLLLTNDNSFQKIFMIVGPPRSGKGTIGRIMEALYGAENVVRPTMSSLGDRFGKEDLIDKSVAIISDARISRADSNALAETLLSISGEDGPAVQQKYEKAWRGKLTTRFLILTNLLPRLNDASGALASRFILLTMKEKFLGREDRGLTNALIQELPGILNWALKGLDRLRERGHFVMPQSSEQQIEMLEDLASPVKAFLRDCCVVGPSESVLVRRMNVAYKEWCEQEGHNPMASNTLGGSLRGLIPTMTRQGRAETRRYIGVGLRDE